MRLLLRFACCPALILAISSTGCNEPPAPEAERDTTASDPAPVNYITPANAPTPVALPWNPIDALLQRLGGHTVSYATNSNGVVICTVKCADGNERRRLQNEVMAITGLCNGTVEPPTVSFPITDLSQFRRYRSMVYGEAAEQARNQDVAARLQQRRAVDEAIARREIQDARAQLQYDQANMIGGPGRGFAVNKAEILSAERSRLAELRANFIEKYGYEP